MFSAYFLVFYFRIHKIHCFEFVTIGGAMKKFLLSIFLILAFFVVSCGNSKKAENDTDILLDEDVVDGDMTDKEAVKHDEEQDEDITEYKNPCEQNPCKNFEHSTGNCVPVNETLYRCDCDKNYYWWGDKNGCIERKPELFNICTGQTKCYNNKEEIECPKEGEDFYGQDAQYAALGFCAPQSFTVKDSDVEDQKTVIDNNTGLEWQQKVVATDHISWYSGESFCENMTYGGYSDWRLPTFTELLTILSYDSSPTINLNYFPDTPPDIFGTSSSLFPSNVLTIDFGEAALNNISLDNPKYDYAIPNYIRCVRGENYETEVDPDFMIEFGQGSDFENVLNGNPSINLIWKIKYLHYHYEKKSWSEYLKYCEELDFAGLSNWRLPNIRELQAITLNGSYLNYGSSSTTVAWNPQEHFGRVQSKEETYHQYICITENPCVDGMVWNGEKCVENPCLPNPCKLTSASLDICIVNPDGKYSCQCMPEYQWDSEIMECVPKEDETPSPIPPD